MSLAEFHREQSKLQSFGLKNSLDNKVDEIVLKQEREKMKTIKTEKLDVTKYVGTKADIVVSEIRNSKFGLVLFLQTNPIELKGDDKLPEGKLLSASIMLGFVEDKDGNLAIGENTKLDKFLKAKDIDSENDIPDSIEEGTVVKKFLGMEVTCQKNDNGFLEIV